MSEREAQLLHRSELEILGQSHQTGPTILMRCWALWIQFLACAAVGVFIIAIVAAVFTVINDIPPSTSRDCQSITDGLLTKEQYTSVAREKIDALRVKQGKIPHAAKGDYGIVDFWASAIYRYCAPRALSTEEKILKEVQELRRELQYYRNR